MVSWRRSSTAICSGDCMAPSRASGSSIAPSRDDGSERSNEPSWASRAEGSTRNDDDVLRREPRPAAPGPRAGRRRGTGRPRRGRGRSGGRRPGSTRRRGRPRGSARSGPAGAGRRSGRRKSCSDSRPWASWPTMNPHCTPRRSGPRAPNIPARGLPPVGPVAARGRCRPSPDLRGEEVAGQRVRHVAVAVAPGSAGRPAGSRPASRGRVAGSGAPGRPTRPGRAGRPAGWAAVRPSRPGPAARRPTRPRPGGPGPRRPTAGSVSPFEGHPAGDLAGDLPVDGPVRLEEPEHLAEIEPPEGTKG